jgi:uncharacterized protein YbcI
MEAIITHFSDDQAIDMMRDFVRTQEKLIAERKHAIEIGGRAPRYSHYTSAESTLENIMELIAA